MTLTAQSASVTRLVLFAEWARANGYRVGEMKPYSVVHRVHSPDSWHYYEQRVNGKVYSLALDLNWSSGGATERSKLKYAVRVARSMGLAVIYAQNGTNGPTSTHLTHAHMDVGSYSNLGTGGFKPTTTTLVTWAMQPALHDKRSNLWDTDFDQRLAAVRAASRFGGTKFPHGIAYTQKVTGAKVTRKWDHQSRVAHDDTIAAIQRAFGVPATKIWNAATEAAYKKQRAALKGKW